MNNSEEQERDEVLENENISESSEAVELTTEQQLEVAQAESAKNLDGWQRAVADLSNARKRFDRQTQLSYTNATVDVVGKLLPVMDDFDRALQNVPEGIAENSWFEGLGGVMRKMDRILESIKAERIPSIGEVFDPNVHEALSTEASDEYESGMVTRELQPGYRIGDRVIRPALVYVAE
ncbi:MAG: molecular chaperone GrpE [Cellvibrionaceae bacterium]